MNRNGRCSGIGILFVSALFYLGGNTAIADNQITQAMAQGKASGQDMLVLTSFMTQAPAACENQ